MYCKVSFHWTFSSVALLITIVKTLCPSSASLLTGVGYLTRDVPILRNQPLELTEAQLTIRSRRQIGTDSLRTLFKPPCFGRFGFFEDPFSCSHYYHCLLNGTHVRRTCMPPLQFHEERQMCVEPGSVDCPEIPDFWLYGAAVAAAANNAGGGSSGSGGGAPSLAGGAAGESGSRNGINAITNLGAPLSASSHGLDRGPSNAPSTQNSNPFLTSPLTFNSAPQPGPGSNNINSGAASFAAQSSASHNTHSWSNPFAGQHPPPQQQHSPGPHHHQSQSQEGNGIPVHRGGFGLGSSVLSRSSPADQDPLNSAADPSTSIMSSPHLHSNPFLQDRPQPTSHHSSPLRAGIQNLNAMDVSAQSPIWMERMNMDNRSPFEGGAGSVSPYTNQAFSARRYTPAHLGNNNIFEMRQSAVGPHYSQLPAAVNNHNPSTSVVSLLNAQLGLGGSNNVNGNIARFAGLTGAMPVSANGPGVNADTQADATSHLNDATPSGGASAAALQLPTKESAVCKPRERGFYADISTQCRGTCPEQAQYSSPSSDPRPKPLMADTSGQLMQHLRSRLAPNFYHSSGVPQVPINPVLAYNQFSSSPSAGSGSYAAMPLHNTNFPTASQTNTAELILPIVSSLSQRIVSVTPPHTAPTTISSTEANSASLKTEETSSASISSTVAVQTTNLMATSTLITTTPQTVANVSQVENLQNSLESRLRSSWNNFNFTDSFPMESRSSKEDSMQAASENIPSNSMAMAFFRAKESKTSSTVTGSRAGEPPAGLVNSYFAGGLRPLRFAESRRALNRKQLSAELLKG